MGTCTENQLTDHRDNYKLKRNREEEEIQTVMEKVFEYEKVGPRLRVCIYF